MRRPSVGMNLPGLRTHGVIRKSRLFSNPCMRARWQPSLVHASRADFSRVDSPRPVRRLAVRPQSREATAARAVLNYQLGRIRHPGLLSALAFEHADGATLVGVQHLADQLGFRGAMATAKRFRSFRAGQLACAEVIHAAPKTEALNGACRWLVFSISTSAKLLVQNARYRSRLLQ